MDELPIAMPEFHPGTVWLVGAGPGDPALLTLLALQSLRQADVVVHDALVDPRILALASPQAVLEFAGKRGGRPSPRQPDISRRLIELAGQGKKVLRLKGGDPFVFGRGGEEALALVAAGIKFRIVPGITAGIGGLAYAGIPLTHRDVNQAVTFVTGHDGSGQVPDRLDWQALAAGSPVLVFYMALRQLSLIVERLTSHGRSMDEPVALLSKATTPEQRIVASTLGRIVADAEAAEIQPPAILVVGRVVDLHKELDWLGKEPA